MASDAKSSPAGAPCLLQWAARELEQEPNLEAVKVDRSAGAVSLATLGDATRGTVADRVMHRLPPVEDGPHPGCALLGGAADCGACPHAADLPGHPRVRVEHTPNSTLISRITCPTAPTFWKWREHPLPRFVPREVRLPEDDHDSNEWKHQLVAALACGLCALAGWALSPHPAGQGLFLLAVLAGAWFPSIETWERLRERKLDIHLLMLAVAAGAASIGAWAESAALLFLFSLSGALEHYAMDRTHREIRSLTHRAPKEAVILDAQGQEQRIAVDALAPGMRALVRPGELFPVDAELLTGATAADESALTGESAPVEKQRGDQVLAGTLNLWGAVEVQVLRAASQSSLQRIIHLIYESQKLRAPSQRFTDRFGTGYTLGILALTLVMFLVWWLAAGRNPWVGTAAAPSAFYLAMTLLVVASPCALVLSIPSAILAAIAHGARRGILFRGGSAVERLAEIDTVAMDKTGTLTTGELRVEAVHSYPPGHENTILQHAFSLERLSSHPLARAITRFGKQHAIDPLPVQQFQSATGLGLEATIEGRPIRLGRREFALAHQADPAPTSHATPHPGVSEVWVHLGDLSGRILLRDDLRAQARETVRQLRADGLHTLALTGDTEATGRLLQSEVELDELHAGLKPEDKVATIRQLTAAGRRVAMVGDGVNDAPALAVAHVGVAMGARGSDAALEQADVVLMHDRLENFRVAHQLSRRATRIIRQNLVISLGTLVVLALLALSGRIPLTQGVLG
ncbi:MAG: heavy metal translocating P-type ATPase, partial [Verrucomicrobiales bacterium]|nr:heavy metal translocating P-type ATPase [Verrucomicrobiales bacterium]